MAFRPATGFADGAYYLAAVVDVGSGRLGEKSAAATDAHVPDPRYYGANRFGSP